MCERQAPGKPGGTPGHGAQAKRHGRLVSGVAGLCGKVSKKEKLTLNDRKISSWVLPERCMACPDGHDGLPRKH